MVRLALILSCLLLAPPAFAQKADPVPQAPEGLELFDATDAAMNAAIAQAQASLPLFFAQVFDANGVAQRGSVKVSFTTFPDNVGQEIIWVGNLRRLPDGSFSGTLNNQPFNLGDWQIGTPVSFTLDQIEDWSHPSAQGNLGNFTTRVIAALPGNGHIWSSLANEPIPAGWR